MSSRFYSAKREILDTAKSSADSTYRCPQGFVTDAAPFHRVVFVILVLQGEAGVVIRFEINEPRRAVRALVIHNPFGIR